MYFHGECSTFGASVAFVISQLSIIYHPHEPFLWFKNIPSPRMNQGFSSGKGKKKNKDHLIRCQDRINKHKEKTHKETDTLVQMSSFKTLHRASNKSSSHFLTQTKKSTKKKRVKQPLYAKASPGGRRNTMYSDIVVFFPLIFRTTVHTSAPYLSLFFTDV